MLWRVRTILIARVCQSINLCQGSQKFRWIFTLFKLWKNWHTLSASWLRNFSFSFVWRHALADVFWSMSKSSSKKTAQRQKEPFRLWTPHKDTTNPKLPACHPWQLKNKKKQMWQQEYNRNSLAAIANLCPMVLPDFMYFLVFMAAWNPSFSLQRGNNKISEAEWGRNACLLNESRQEIEIKNFIKNLMLFDSTFYLSFINRKIYHIITRINCNLHIIWHKIIFSLNFIIIIILKIFNLKKNNKKYKKIFLNVWLYH